ncbi:MAG: hypothetical protein HWE21_17410 [Cytophagia bacterium]|nr:hypothetical protein [Cytophagia bacterium]
MTIKEAILKSLEDLKKPSTYLEVYDQIMLKGYYPHFETKDTPQNTVSSQIGDFIRKSDDRVKRIILDNNVFGYYLSKDEHLIDSEVLSGATASNTTIVKKASYEERDLHTLLATYLNFHNISSKTIYHEKSKNSKDKNQKWIHPDMVGVAFLKLKNENSRALQRTVNNNDTFKINSYELKKEINTDYELKEAFFQAVSNSTWANHGFLVAFYINESLEDEIKRLNQSFGIGVIELKANPFESKLHHPARYKKLDFKTIDKLCKINNDFNEFIAHTEKVLTSPPKYADGAEKGLISFCDQPLITDSEIEKYCLDKNIPFEKDEDENMS